jgi:hypothetical protein
MSCPICGGTMVGDGHTTLRHCEFARDEDIEGKEPDAGPVYCVEITSPVLRHAILPGRFRVKRNPARPKLEGMALMEKEVAPEVWREYGIVGMDEFVPEGEPK